MNQKVRIGQSPISVCYLYFVRKSKTNANPKVLVGATQPKVRVPTAAHYQIEKMITFFVPREQVTSSLKLVVTRNNGTIDKLDVLSIEQAEMLASTFKAATLWMEVKGKGLIMVGINT